MPPKSAALIKHSLAPWISVPVGAIDFYKSAFDATEVYHHNDPSGGVVVRLSVKGAEFWLSQESPDSANPASEPVGGGMIRLILTVPNPDEVFDRAVKAGAKEIYPVSEGHGWRVGHISDPYGLHWEIGYPLASSCGDSIDSSRERCRIRRKRNAERDKRLGTWRRDGRDRRL